MISCSDAIRAIERERKDAVVVATTTPNRYWEKTSSNRDLDLPIAGTKGKAASVALGLALSLPERKVIVLDGDGGLLTNLGGLITIADQGPENLVHFVFEDGIYFTTGGQPVPGRGKFDLAGIAKSAGIEESYQFDDLEEFVSDLPEIMNRRGPVFVCLKVRHTGDVPEFHAPDTSAAARQLAARLHQP